MPELHCPARSARSVDASALPDRDPARPTPATHQISTSADTPPPAAALHTRPVPIKALSRHAPPPVPPQNPPEIPLAFPSKNHCCRPTYK